MTLYDEKYFATQLSKSKSKIALQYGQLLKYGGYQARTHPRLLDAGCGAGPALAFLVEQDFKVVGSDFVFYPLLEAAKRVPDVPLLHSNLDDGLPFQDAAFDIILASEIIEHLQKVDQFLAQAYRVLAPNGLILITTPNLWDIRRAWASLSGTTWSGYRDPGHISLMQPLRLRRMLYQAGFQRVRWRSGIKPAYSRSIRRWNWRFEIPYPPMVGNGLMFAAYK